MYGFPDSQALEFLNGAEFSQICIGKNELIFNFYPEKIRILITSVDSFYECNKPIFSNIDHILELLGNQITNISTIDKQTLKITTGNGSSIILKDDSDQYESVVISSADEVIAV